MGISQRQLAKRSSIANATISRIETGRFNPSRPFVELSKAQGLTAAELRLALIRLAKRYGRYGYRTVAKLLWIEGWRVNHKKTERIWREQGLQLPDRHKQRRRLYHKDSSAIRLRPLHPNHVWSVDCALHRLATVAGATACRRFCTNTCVKRRAGD